MISLLCLLLALVGTQNAQAWGIPAAFQSRTSLAASQTTALNTASSVNPFHTAQTTAASIDSELATKLEAVVLRYFQGVDEKNATMIRSCFGSLATIRDVCSLTHEENAVVQAKQVDATILVERCMDFVTAHPDVTVRFHVPPTCLRNALASSSSTTDSSKEEFWVFAHWYEVGTWSGLSCGLEPTQEPMNVEGQTRFRVCPETFTIQELVVTRTFTAWEKAFLLAQQQEQS